MGSEPLVPLSTLAKQLEYCEGTQFLLILKKLASPIYINEHLLKSGLSLVTTRIQKLLHSARDYDVWKGCHASMIICFYNPLVLCVHGGQILATIYSRLEQKKEYHATYCELYSEKLIFKTLTSALLTLIDLMRGKPTLSRESLVPKLKAIIPCLVDLAVLEPGSCLPILKELLLKNTTTFRPFFNRYREVLLQLITEEYDNLDSQIQSLICENYAYLHLIKPQGQSSTDEYQSHHKAFHDETWRTGLLSILAQFKPVLELCNEILDLDYDQDLKGLIEKLQYDDLYSPSHILLPGLKIDLNEPITLWQIPMRVNLLVDLLTAFLNLPTPYTVRIPLGGCISVFEALLGMTLNFLPLRREIRHDAELTSTVSDILPQIQFSGLKLLDVLIRNFGKCCLSMLPSILGSLEFFIPLESRSRNIDMTSCKSARNEFLFYFQLLNSIFPHMSYQSQELDFFSKLVEVALSLSSDHNLVSNLTDKIPAKNQITKAGKKQKKDGCVGALSDIYTHPHEFVLKTSLVWHDQINLFLRGLLNNMRLPSNQQIKIITYTVQNSLMWKKRMGHIPQSFIQLLRSLVIHPGKERVSILPIAVSLLKDSSDEVFDLLCHPRLPMNMILNVEGTQNNSDGGQSQGEESPENAADQHEEEKGTVEIEPEIEPSSVKKHNSETQLIHESPKKQKLETTVPLFQSKNYGLLKSENEPPIISKENKFENEPSNIPKENKFPAPTDESSGSESEMVIPQIHLSDDEDEDIEEKV